MPKTRHFFVVLGLYFPSFFLQLYAIKQNINPTLAFYSVCLFLTRLQGIYSRRRVASHPQCYQCRWANSAELVRTRVWRNERCVDMQHELRYSDFFLLGCEKCRRLYSFHMRIRVLPWCLYGDKIHSLSNSNSRIDISVQGPMLAGLAKRDSEIGERFGIYFALTGAQPRYHLSFHLNLPSAFGALIGSRSSGRVYSLLIFFQVTRLLEHFLRHHIHGGKQFYSPDLPLSRARCATSVLVSLWQSRRVQASCRFHQRIGTMNIALYFFACSHR